MHITSEVIKYIRINDTPTVCCRKVNKNKLYIISGLRNILYVLLTITAEFFDQFMRSSDCAMQNTKASVLSSLRKTCTFGAVRVFDLFLL